MQPIVGTFLLLAVAAPALASELQDAPATLAEEYAALLSEYRTASGGMRTATTDRERKAAVERMGSYAPKFIQVAEKHPGEAIVLEVLRQAIQVVGSTDSGAQIAWETNRSDYPAGCSDGSAGRIVTVLLRDYVNSDKLGPVIDRMRYGYRMEFARFLSTVLSENPHRDVQAVACLALAQFLNDRLRMLELVEDRPELAACYEIVFGKEYLSALQQLGRGDLIEQIETLFERAANEYGDVELPVGGTVGTRAKSELYGIRHLGIGKAAPDITGTDQDGVEFQLSDYRGKVVLLYFWSEY